MKRVIAAMLVLSSTLYAGDFPWSKTAPAEIIRESVLPDRVLDEEPCNWRPVITPLISPEAKKCKSAREAVLHIAGNIGKLTGAYYSKERRKHNMNALEALHEKKISCTGQSILLICALRSVDIPARAVGVHTWNHISGNHTWVEAWFDGQWHMIEFNEPDFNTPWVMENIGMLNPDTPEQRIMAATPTGTSLWIPLDAETPDITAEDVTERYLEQARQWYENKGVPRNTQRLLIDIQPRNDSAQVAEIIDKEDAVISSGMLPTSRNDMRYLTRLTLPREGEHYLRLRGETKRMRLHPTDAPVQILNLTR